MDLQELQAFLAANNIAYHTWGRNGSKRLEDLLTELHVREAILVVDNRGRVLRIARRVLVNVMHVRSDHTTVFLYEACQIFPDGSERERQRSISLSETWRWTEDEVEAALRGLKEELNVHRVASHLLRLEEVSAVEEHASLAYPGLLTVNFGVRFSYLMPRRYYRREYREVGEDGVTTVFRWRNTTNTLPLEL